eukprot:tig00020938_g16135.t1
MSYAANRRKAENCMRNVGMGAAMGGVAGATMGILTGGASMRSRNQSAAGHITRNVLPRAFKGGLFFAGILGIGGFLRGCLEQAHGEPELWRYSASLHPHIAVADAAAASGERAELEPRA